MKNWPYQLDSLLQDTVGQVRLKGRGTNGAGTAKGAGGGGGGGGGGGERLSLKVNF